jgi:CheY-like chemotaxis protein
MPNVPINGPTGTIVVLVVEDEVFIRTLAVESFAEMRFGVVEAPDADIAIGVLQIAEARIQVLFTDVQMPGAMGGSMLAHHTRRNWPRT